MKKIIYLPIFTSIICSLFIIVILPAIINGGVKCIDGDTFKIGNTYYRLAYIDTPEKGKRGYDISSRLTCDYLNSGYIKIEETGIDIYGRTLAVVSRPRYGTATLNEKLVRSCFAEPFYNKTTEKIVSIYSSNCQ